MDAVVLCDIISVNQQEVRENEVSSKWELIHLDLASLWWKMLAQLSVISRC